MLQASCFLSFRLCFLQDLPSSGLEGRTPPHVGLACSAPHLPRIDLGLQVFSLLGWIFYLKIWIRV